MLYGKENAATGRHFDLDRKKPTQNIKPVASKKTEQI